MFFFASLYMPLHVHQVVYIPLHVHPVNKGLVPIHYKYFVRNLTLHHFLKSPEVWNMPEAWNMPSKPDSVATFF